MSYTELVRKKIMENSYTEVAILLSKIKDIPRSKKCLEFLQVCVSYNRPEIADLLLTLGVSPNGRSYMYVPLHESVLHLNVPMVKLLLSHGANPDVIDDQGHTILTRCAGSKAVAAIDLFDAVLEDGRADLEKCNNHGNTPLIAATLHRKFEMIQKLVNAGANIEGRNKHGDTSLLVAIHKANERGVRWLLQLGADVNNKSPQGITPLHVAVEKCDQNICQVLIDYNADINSPNHNGKTTLMIAATANDVHMVKFLLAHGADPNLRNNANITALDLVNEMSRKDFILGGKVATKERIDYIRYILKRVTIATE